LDSRQEWLEVAKLLGQSIPTVWRERNAPVAQRQKRAFEFFNGVIEADALPFKSFLVIW
jgi:hypothetical protein